MRTAGTLSARGDLRGMTLLEIMLALFLFGMLAVFVMQVIDSVLNLWSAGERRGRGDLVFASAVERFRGDLRAMHTGPRGWMILDTWEVAAATEGQSVRHLPRLRFLADGAAMPEVDPTGRAAVEVMWAMVPETASSNRFGRLMRFVRLEDPIEPLQDAGIASDLLRSGTGLVVMDGVLWVEMSVVDDSGNPRSRFRVEAFQPFDFPPSIELVVELVSGKSRKHPPLLDHAVGAESTSVLLRGTAPVTLPKMALVDEEWVQVSGRFPSLSFSGRGQRGTLAASHGARSEVLFPVAYASENSVAAGGKRLP